MKYSLGYSSNLVEFRELREALRFVSGMMMRWSDIPNIRTIEKEKLMSKVFLEGFTVNLQSDSEHSRNGFRATYVQAMLHQRSDARSSKS